MSNNIARPENQHGQRLAPKFSKDTVNLFDQVMNAKNKDVILEILEKSK